MWGENLAGKTVVAKYLGEILCVAKVILSRDEIGGRWTHHITFLTPIEKIENKVNISRQIGESSVIDDKYLITILPDEFAVDGYAIREAEPAKT